MPVAPHILILQGPLSPYYSDIAGELAKGGAAFKKVHICGNDRMDWHHLGAREFTGKLGDFSRFLQSNFADQGITHVLMHGDRRPYHKIGVEFAKSIGAEILVTELGYLRPDWMTLEKGGVSTLSHFPTHPERIKATAEKCPPLEPSVVYPDQPMTRIIHELKFNFFNWLYKRRFPHYESHRTDAPWTVYQGFLMRQLEKRKAKKRGKDAFMRAKTGDGRLFVFALQLAGDFQLRDHSPFQNLDEAIETVLRSFASHGASSDSILIKPHPLDFTLSRTKKAMDQSIKRHALKDRVYLVEGLSIKALCREAAGFVTINSSAGMEALEAGTPTHTVMPTLYDIDGLTFQGVLDDFWRSPSRPDPDLLARFKRAIAGTIQVRGTIYNEKGRQVAAANTAKRILSGEINSHGAYEKTPPRITKAEKMGLFYDHF